MRKVCILMLVAVILSLIIHKEFNVEPIDILIFIVVTFTFDRICSYIIYYLGKYRELRKERERFELIIQKIEDNLRCQKNIQ